MSIRDTSYWTWSISDYVPSKEGTLDCRYHSIKYAADGNLYACGQYKPVTGYPYTCFLKRSRDNGSTWEIIDTFTSGSSISVINAYWDVCVGDGGTIYVVGTCNAYWIVRRSISGSAPFETVDSFKGTSTAAAYCCSPGVNGQIFVGGHRDDGPGEDWTIKSGSSVFSEVDHFGIGGMGSGPCLGLAVNRVNGYVYATGQESGSVYTTRRSTTGGATTWTDVDGFKDGATWTKGQGIFIASGSNDVYTYGSFKKSGVYSGFIRRSTTLGSSGSFGQVNIDFWPDGLTQYTGDHRSNGYVGMISGSNEILAALSEFTLRRSSSPASSGSFSSAHRNTNPLGSQVGSVVLGPDGYIYVAGHTFRSATSTESAAAYILKGRLSANSMSLGPQMLNTSFGYVFSEISGTIDERFKLNNVSEFPHSSGYFQMRNVGLGTVDSGRIGTAEDSIIQVKHIGSVVKVLWPPQADQNTLVKGYGDFSIGERVGKLSTTFEPGDLFDVATEKYDHVSLYCYLLKGSTGTSDNIEIRIERRPLKDKGFAVDQSIEYATSGSVTVATLRDILYQKAIDYSDLSIREIGLPIDVPLTNTREIRVSARQVNGQASEDNRNLIIWGRFIKTQEEV